MTRFIINTKIHFQLSDNLWVHSYKCLETLNRQSVCVRGWTTSIKVKREIKILTMVDVRLEANRFIGRVCLFYNVTAWLELKQQHFSYHCSLCFGTIYILGNTIQIKLNWRHTTARDKNIPLREKNIHLTEMKQSLHFWN